MNAPKGPQTPKELMDAIMKHVTEHYRQTDEGDICSNCGQPVQQTTAYVSVHDAAWTGCAGTGEVVQVPLPFCPTCEGQPTETSTCIHFRNYKEVDELSRFANAV